MYIRRSSGIFRIATCTDYMIVVWFPLSPGHSELSDCLGDSFVVDDVESVSSRLIVCQMA